jgi:hypothetical protein
MDGLGMIRNDADVYRIVATKELVSDKSQMGVDLIVAEFSD